MLSRTRALRFILLSVVCITFLLFNASLLQAQGNVTILVVDDFSGRSLEQISGDFANFPGELCGFSPQSIGQGRHAMSRGLGPNVEGWTHGESVVNLLWSINGADLDIQGVPINSYRAQDIVNQIRPILDAPQQSFVVNMSFAFIPCELYPMLVALDEAAMQDDWDYFAAILSEVETAYRQFNASNNPLRPITDLENVIVVASAGNFGFDFPLLPAGWPNVVSVSANESEDLSEAPLLDMLPVRSNNGEIQMPGIWEAQQVVGTSYAAPRLSYRMGLFLQQFQGRCENGSVPLDYEGGFQWPNGDWRNIPPPGQEGEFCDIVGAAPVARFTLSIVEPSNITGPDTLSCALNWNLDPNFGYAELAAGFLPDPFSVDIRSGGPCNASASAGPQCVGYVASSPDFRLNWSGSSSRIRIYFQAQGGDTTLIINDPSGGWHCNDDSSNINPMIEFTSPRTGRYDIWVGSYSQNENINGTLSITERDLMP